MTKEQIAQDINVLARFCRIRDVDELTQAELKHVYGFEQADVFAFIGGSILHGADLLAEAMRNQVAKTYMLVGGAGHTTDTLRRRMEEVMPGFVADGLTEAELFNTYLKHFYGLEADLLEAKSTNCGNNVTYMMELLEENGINCSSIIMMQDSTMQRRMDAVFRKQRGEEITLINYAPYEAEVMVRDGELAYAREFHGMWKLERYLTLLMGEISRLTDNEDGYGPRGKGYLIHVDIPEEVQSAFEELKNEYGGIVRKANPLYG